MRNLYKIVICEGKTDRILIGKYLTKKYDLHNRNDLKDTFDFRIKYVNDFYQKDDINIFVVEAHSSTELNACMKYFRDMMKFLEDDCIDKIVIVTDHDDKHAVGFCQNVKEVFNIRLSGKEKLKIGHVYNIEIKISDNINSCQLMYLIIPEINEGALETFLVEVLANVNNQFIIDGIKKFLDSVENMEHRSYLKTRGQRTKALLSMLLSAMYPERNNIPFNFLDEIDWTAKEKFNQFFDRVGNMLIGNSDFELHD